MRHCRIHGRYSDPDGCWECRQGEKRARADQQVREQIANHLESSRGSKDYGDYICPHCNYQTLRRGARRCPECHADPGGEFWTMQYEGERRIKEIRERDAALQCAKDEKSRKEFARTAPIWIYFGYFMPMLAIWSMFFVNRNFKSEFFGPLFCSFVPLVNWIVFWAFAYAYGSNARVIWASTMVWVVVGGILSLWCLRRPKSS